MEPLPRTLIIVSVVLIWCSFSMVHSRPLHPKKHTTSPFKHHQHHSSAHKNAIMHPLNPTSLRELAFGSHKAAREILPFPLPPVQKQPSHRHHKPTWGAFKPIAPPDHDQTDENAVGPVVDVPAPQPAIPGEDGFGPWVPHGTTHPDKDLGPDGVFGGPIIPTGTKTVEDSGFGAWGAFKPVHHTPAEDGFGGNSRTSGGTSKAIHIVPGQAPHVIEESIGPDGFGTFVSSSDDTADDTSDGWFMSFVPYPQPTHDQEPTESSSSSAAFADMWGLFRDRKRGCDMSVEGRSCSSNSECQGCRTFQCSTNHRCQKV